MLITIKIFAFLFAIFPLVLIHEFGHFFVARLCGVRILKFSIGFGKALMKWRDKKGTSYVLSAIPLGGYVKMLDTREIKASLHDYPFAFDHHPAWQRFLIIVAGPVNNLLFALVIFSLMFVIGIKVPKPIIGKIEPNSIASRAHLVQGQEITAVSGKKVLDWQEVVFAIFPAIGEDGNLIFTAKKQGQENKYVLDLTSWQLDPFQPDPLKSLGIIPYHPSLPPVIAKIKNNSPAAKFGLRLQDRIQSVNRKRVLDWDDFITQVQEYPNQKIDLVVLRDGKVESLNVVTSWKYDIGWKKVGYLGVGSLPVKWPDDMLLDRNYSVAQSFYYAGKQAWMILAFNGISFAKLLTGKISFHVLGGPITIFQSAATAINAGIVVYFGFLALLSIMLAFVNFLPIPGLDGGHVLFIGIESLLRRPISMRVQALILRFGLILLILIMVQATINDVMRMF